MKKKVVKKSVKKVVKRLPVPLHCIQHVIFVLIDETNWKNDKVAKKVASMFEIDVVKVENIISKLDF